MDYVIYTFGGGDLLWHVFNGIGESLLQIANTSLQ
ncbi:putative conjugative transfer protein TraG [Orientia tsutsugamushi str. UT144]|uniref:Conjugative transfer TraG domain protein n=1 Tax=Orientia tsutsugamushi str. UT144 TaxID=1441384 RepID=A0A0F3RL36_ORITS|nr:conjugative transfer TraG domain protein [Orientia tsutsugamushi str. UT144]KJW06857.1 putative conjugative transfer protein TraG [Orientia tsutsugamushi str. UT144]